MNATLIAMVSMRSISSGVIEAPTATPSTVRIASLTTGTPLSGAFSSAASRQANIGPSSSGSGNPSR